MARACAGSDAPGFGPPTADGRPAAADSGGAGDLAGPLLVLVSSLLVYLLVKQLTGLIADSAPGYVFHWLAVMAIAGAVFSWVSYRDLQASVALFVRGSAVFLVVYLALEPFDIPYAAIDADAPAAVFHAWGRWIGLAAALIGLGRPAGVFVAAMVVWMVRDLQTPITGFYFSDLDIRNMLEVIALVCIGACLSAAAYARQSIKDRLGVRASGMRRAGTALLAAGIGGHLGNYFYSALAKLSLDGGPLSWLLHNRLESGMLGAMEKGTMPFMASPEVTQWLYHALAQWGPLLGLGAFLAQFAAIAAPLRRRWVIGITASYDLFHLVVYLVFGLLFWKWIALNTIILAVMLRTPGRHWDRFAVLVCMVFVAGSAAFFKTATLAWYDTDGFVSVRFEAGLDDGTRIPVPNAYFASASYQVSQGRLYMPSHTGHFNFSIWGSVLSWRDAAAGWRCEPPDREQPVPAKYGPLSDLRRYVSTHHEQVLSRIDEQGIVSYYLLPHHHVPAPFVKDAFHEVDKRRIREYYYLVESVCLDLHDGRLQRRVVERNEYPMLRSGS